MSTKNRITELETVSIKSSRLKDILLHMVLPKVTPSSEQSRLDYVDGELLHFASQTISKYIDENNLEKLLPLRSMFQRWSHLHPVTSQSLFVKQFQAEIQQLAPNHTIPLYIRKQNVTLLIRKNSNGKIEISTFRNSLPSSIIMKSVHAVSMNFPETCDLIQNSDLLASTTFANKIYELITQDHTIPRKSTAKNRDHEFSDTRDLPEPFLVTEWLVGCLVPFDASVPITTCQKKIRDQVTLKREQGSGSNLPFRRSGMWLSIKVALQLKLLEIFGGVGNQAGEAKAMHKIILLHILTKLGHQYHLEMAGEDGEILEVVEVDFDFTTQLMAKLARRADKLEHTTSSGVKSDGTTPNTDDETEQLKAKCLEHAFFIVCDLNQTMNNRWIEMINADRQTDNSARQAIWNRRNIRSDLNHDIPELQKLLTYFRGSNGSMDITARKRTTILSSSVLSGFASRYSGESRGMNKSLEVKRYHSLSSLLQQIDQQSYSSYRYHPRQNQQTSVIWLRDAETYVKFEMNQACHSSSELLKLFTGYMTVAGNTYQHNPIGISQMYLVLLQLHQKLDQLTCENFPMLREYKSEVSSGPFDKLLLPHSADMKLLDEILLYFKSRDSNATQSDGIVSTGVISSKTFSVRFARQSEEMGNMKAKILLDTEKKIEEKLEEVKATKEACEGYKREMQVMSCECKYELKEFRGYRGKRYSKYIKIETCARCRLQEKFDYERKSVSVYERPLPPDETWKDAIVFELCIPNEISDWRDSLAILKYELLGEKFTGSGSTSHNGLSSYHKISTYGSSNFRKEKQLCICNSNSTSSLARSQTDVYDLFPERSFIVNNNLHCAYNYKRNLGYDAPETVKNLTKICTFQVENTSNSAPYTALQHTLESTAHTQNQIISDQSSCHQKLSLDEFITFGSLRAGHRIQLRNLYRAIYTQDISVEEEPVLALILQTIWQIGPREQNGCRESHLDFQEEKFSLGFLEMLGQDLVMRNKSNYSNPLILLMAVVITMRIMELNPDPESQEKCYCLLKTWRNEVINKWVVKIAEELKKSSADVKSLKKNLMQIRVCSAFTFYVARDHSSVNIRRVMKDEEDVVHWFNTLQDLNEFTDTTSLSEFSRELLQTAKNIALELALENYIGPDSEFPFVRDAITKFAQSKWTKAATCVFKNITVPLPDQSGSLIDIEYEQQDRANLVHHLRFDLFLGTFLVNGFSQSELPPEVAGNQLFKRFFREHTNLRVQRESEYVTRTIMPFHGKHYTYIHLMNDQLTHILQFLSEDCSYGFNILIEEVQNDSTILRLLNPNLFRNHIPTHLVDNYTHWLNTRRGEIYFRRIPTKEEDYDLPPEYTFKLALKRESCFRLLDSTSGHPFVSVKSRTFREVVGALASLETSQYIDVNEDDCGNITAHLRRHQLRFKINFDRKILESVEYPGYHIASDQSSGFRKTLLGLQQCLLLQSGGNMELLQTTKHRLIVPHGKIKIVPGVQNHSHHKTFISLDKLREPSFFVYDVDTVLKRYKPVGKSKAAWLYLAALHASTASPLEDPPTRFTGTEMAMQILQSAFLHSSAPYDKECLKTLAYIWNLSPKRIYYGASADAVSMTKKLLSVENDQVSSLPQNKRTGTMESIEWPKGIPSMAAYDGFALIVEKLIENSLKLHRLYTEDDSQLCSIMREAGFHEVHSSDHLQARAYRRSLPAYNQIIFLNDSLLPESFTKALSSQPTQLDSLHVLRSSSDPSNFAQLLEMSTIRFLKEDKSKMIIPNSADLQEFLIQPKLIASPHPKISGKNFSLSSLLAFDLRSNWLKLYDWATSKKTAKEEFDFTLVLSTLGYRGAPLEQLQNLHHISQLSCAEDENGLLDFPPVPNVTTPKGTRFTQSDYSDPTSANFDVSKIEAILKSNAKSFDKTRYSYGYTSEAYNKFLQEKLEFDKKTERDCLKVSRHLKTHWPCEIITLSEESIKQIGDLHFEVDNYWNTRSGLEINKLVYFWHENLRLQNFIKDVESKLNSAYISLRTTQSATTIQIPRLPTVMTTPSRCKYVELAEIKLEEILKQNLSTEMKADLEEIFVKGKLPQERPQEPNNFSLLKHKVEMKINEIFDTIYNALVEPEAKPRVRILHMAGLGPRLTPLNILKLLKSCSESETILQVTTGALGVLWTHLNRLHRCLCIQSAPGFAADSPDLKREQDNPGHTNWSPKEYPEWLLIELELDIMIRDVQVDVARRMMSMPENNGNGVMQLNMGEGKTSVIVPMLCSKLATKESLCRVTVLSSMFNMNLAILQFAIGGLLNRRVSTIPCRRDMKIDEDCAEAILKCYQESLEMKDVVLTLPEHRLSFRLLGYDKMFRSKGTDILGQKLLSVENWLRQYARDILDESDELFSVKYQLVYTVGEKIPIDGGDLRWSVSQALLEIVQKLGPQLLLDYGESMVEFGTKHDSQGSHEFPHFRLLYHKIDQSSSSLVKQFFENFISRVADQALTTILGDFTQDQKRLLKEFVTEPEVSKETFSNVMTMCQDAPEQLEKILIISGHLRRGVLPLALGKRWRVEYGVDNKGFMTASGKPRWMAVPFRAKDVAAEKTEYGHPDLAIILTQLSYYYSGLGDQQLDECFQILNGKIDPDSEYRSWINQIPASKRDPSMLTYRNINLKDTGQKLSLFGLLRRHKMVIDFWLSHRVFPNECKQFSGKLVMTAWDLCYERYRHPVCGFSGTKDTSILLPLPLTQQDLPSLLDTNARMEMTLMKPVNGNHKGFQMGVTCRQILEKMKTDKLTILIDSGALMLECSNEEVAKLWLDVDPEAEAAVYFSKDNELLVKSRSSLNQSKLGALHDTPFDLSSYQGRLDKCVVFLDDQHTRGTDLKFPYGSRACVTIGSGMKRDKLFQACMRMRKLESGHSVTFYMSHEAHDKILKATRSENLPGEVTTAEVIQWVTKNTDEFNQEGLLYWAIAGKNYAQRLAAEDEFHGAHASQPYQVDVTDSSLLARAFTLSKQCVDDEVTKLEDMYGQFTEIDLVSKLVPEWFHHSKKKLNHTAQLTNSVHRFDIICEAVQLKCETYAAEKKHFFTSGGTMEEEQEKELEYEMEIEVEEERVIERLTKSDPATPYLHPNVRHALVNGYVGLEEGIISRLPDIFKDTTFWNDVQPEGWSGEVYATHDFISVIRKNSFHSKTDSYLRPVEYIASIYPVSSKEPQLLLLSPFEVNEMMDMFRLGWCKGRLHMFAMRKTETGDILVNREKLQLPDGDPVALEETSASHAALLMASGSLYFKSMPEQMAFVRFLSIVPNPRSAEELDLFEIGLITKTGFLKPEGRKRGNEDAEQKCFMLDPTSLLRNILLCRHPMVSQKSHVERLLESKQYVDIRSDL